MLGPMPRGGADPKVRASWCKLVVGTVKRRPEPLRSELLDALSDVRDAIRPLGITAWAPVDVLLSLDETLTAIVGEDGSRDLWRDNLLEAVDSVLLAPIAATSLRLYGRSPASLLRMSPRIHDLIAKDCGTLAVTRLDEGAVDVELAQLPVPLQERPGLRRAYVATCDACLDYLDVVGEVREDDSALDEGVSRILVRWDA